MPSSDAEDLEAKSPNERKQLIQIMRLTKRPLGKIVKVRVKRIIGLLVGNLHGLSAIFIKLLNWEGRMVIFLLH